MTRRVATTLARPELWLGLLFLWVSVSALRSQHTPWADAALTEWLRWATGLSLMLSLGTWLTRTRQAARVLAACAGVITVVGIADGVSQAHGGMVGPFRDHQLCGSAILTLLPFTLAVALTTREPRWKWGAQIIGMAALICLVMTETRSAWVGAAAAGLAYAGLWWWRSRLETGKRPGKQLLVPILLIVGVGLGSFLILSTSDLNTTLSGRAATLQRIGRDNDWQQRLVMWRGAARMVSARPLYGYGLGRYPGLQWHFTNTGRVLSPTERPSLSEQAHDFYLQTTAETGLVGLVLYLAVLGTLVGQSIASLRQMEGQPVRSRDGFLVATLATVAGLSVDAVASPSYQFAEVSLFVWIALGVGLAALNHREQPETDIRLPAPVLWFCRFATAGVLSLLVLSLFVPLGLLTPVEAYTGPQNSTYQATMLTGTATSANVGDTVQYSLVAQYQDASGNTDYYNVTSDSTSSYVATWNGSTASGTFGAKGGQSISYTVGSDASGKTLTIKGTFQWNGANHNAISTLQVN